MKVFLFLIISCGIYSCDGEESNQDHSQENTGTIIEPSFDKKNAFLNRPEILDSVQQADLFSKIQGLWNYDKIDRIEDEKIIEKDHEDVYFMERMAWPLDYPCCWPHKVHGERVYMTADSIFFSTDGYSYLSERRYEIRKDSLLIHGTTANGREHWVEYYSRRAYDQEIIDSLDATGFNKKCLSGKWKLEDIMDNKMENYPPESKSFNYLPKQINMEEYQIQGNLIYLENDPSVQFKLVSVRRLNADFGGGLSIWLQDLEPGKEGYTYFYHPE